MADLRMSEPASADNLGARNAARQTAAVLIKREIDKGTKPSEIGRKLVEAGLHQTDSMSVGMAVSQYWKSQQAKVDDGELERPCGGECVMNRLPSGRHRCAHSGLFAAELGCDEPGLDG